MGNKLSKQKYGCYTKMHINILRMIDKRSYNNPIDHHKYNKIMKMLLATALYTQIPNSYEMQDIYLVAFVYMPAVHTYNLYPIFWVIFY